MDFLNKTFAQIADLFKSMSPGARITAGMLLVLIAISMAYLFQHQSTSADAYLMAGDPLPSGQIPAMEAAFGKAGLKDHSWEGNRLRVPKHQQATYMAALADEGALPPDLDRYLERSLTSAGPFTPRPVQLELMKAAKQTMLQTWISKMRGVEAALVMINLPERRGLHETKVTASVSVRPAGMQSLDEERVAMLRHFVASSIGAEPGNVTVTDATNGRVYAGGSEGSGSMLGSFGDPYISRKREHEREWSKKIGDALSYIQGALVTVNVELDTEIQHEERVVELDPKAVAVRIDEQKSTKTSKTVAPAGRPGLAAQGGVNQAASLGSAGGPENNEENEKTQTENAIPSRVRQTAQQGLTPKRVTASIAIPMGYYEQIWNLRNPAADGQPAKKPDAAALEEIKKSVKIEVENTVVNLLPRQDPTLDRYPLVTVSTFQQIAHAPIPQPSMQQQAMSWLTDHGSKLGMSLLALCSLVMLRSMVRSTTTTAAASAELPSMASMPREEEIDEPQEQTARSRLKRRAVSGPSLRDELSDMVREDPDSAVAILRNWIGTAS